MNIDLERYGPWALVTGASSGIGEHFARHLARAGMNLILVARRGERLQELKKELTADRNIEVEVVEADLSTLESVDQIIAAVGNRDLGLIVSNAGTSLVKGEFTADSREQLEGNFNLNTRSPLLLLHGLLPRLRARGRAGVILTGSVEAEMPAVYSAAYSASKAFIQNLGLSLYCELKPVGVDLLVLAPGATATEALTRQGLTLQDLPSAMAPAEVSRQALAALGRKPLHIAGTSNRVMVLLFRLLPRSWGIALASKGTLAVLKKRRLQLK